MKKIGIIISREYLSRVKKRTFILTTLGLPLVFLGFSFLMGYLASTTQEKLKVAVVDETNIFENKLWDSNGKREFQYFKPDVLASLQKTYSDSNFTCLLYIKKGSNAIFDNNSIQIYSKDNLSLDASEHIENRLNKIYRNKLMLDAGIQKAQVDSLSDISLKVNSITESKKKTDSGVASILGNVSGFLIYIIMFIYGTMVMRSVMEEKTNRIAEVIVSSVKPFELMMGKVIGVALVGLTQFILWAVFMGLISTIALKFFGIEPSMLSQTPTVSLTPEMMETIKNKQGTIDMFKTIHSINWLEIILYFILYFMGGYFLYASLFAAVGSMVNEDMQEAQSLTLPITMPIILGFFISMQAARNPHSGLAMFGSLFPLTSPLVMMARIPYGVPAWQIVISLLLLFGTFILTIWLAGKIYRTGILMYGKKLTWGDAIKWIRRG
jgi:ABC-2 type transport system permease protein